MQNQPRILKQRKQSLNKYQLENNNGNTILLNLHAGTNAASLFGKDREKQKQKQREPSMGARIRSTSALSKPSNFNGTTALMSENETNRNSLLLSTNAYNKTLTTNIAKAEVPKGHSLVVWGDTSFLGSDYPSNRTLHKHDLPMLLAQNILKVSLGQTHVVYITNRSEAFGVGNSTFGQLGYFQPTQNQTTMQGKGQVNQYGECLNKTAIPLLQQFLVEDVYCTPFCTFLATNRDQIYGCGLNNRGQLGLSNINQTCLSTPTKIHSISKRPLLSKQRQSSGMKSSKKFKPSTKIQSYALAQKNQRNLISQQSKLLTQKSQNANSDIYLNTNNLQTQMSNQLQENKKYQEESQDTQCLLQDDEVIRNITGGPYHTIALTNKGRVFYTGNIYKKSAILNNQYTPKFAELNLKKIGKVQKIRSGLSCIGLLNIQGNLYLLGAINDSIICDEPYNVGIDCIVDFAIGKDKIYVVTAIGDVWVLAANKQSFKTSKLNFGQSKIVAVSCGLDYCFFKNREGEWFGQGNNFFNIFGRQPEQIKRKPALIQESTKQTQGNEPIFALKYNINISEIKAGYNFVIGLNDKYPDKYQIKNNQFNKQNILQQNNQNLMKKIQQLQKQNKVLKQLTKNQNSDSPTKKLVKNSSSKNKQHTNSNNAACNSNHLTKKTSNYDNTGSKFDMNLNISQKVMNKARKFDNSMEIPFQEIQLGKQISEGGYGVIYKANWRKTTVAVKIFKIDTNSQNSIKDFVSECHAMQALRHPNIVMFLGACTKPPNFAIVLQYCQGGTLWSILQKNGELSWQQRRRLALDTARGMNYLHQRPTPILHRDLKSLNLLLDQNKRVKLADFGWTKGLQNYMTGKIGTYQWMAPQVVSSHQYTEKADVFSFAIILWQIASREAPYRNIPGVQVAQDVLHKDLRPVIPKKTPQNFAALMKRCWDKVPENRPSFAQIIDQLETMQLPN